MTKIPVLEIFGPTIQGEGMVVGQKTMFVRTAGCDYSCAWCDSSFTWDGSGKDLIMQMDAEEIWRELERLGGDRFSHVTISGGNPALLKSLSSLVTLLKAYQIKICLETQGSRWQDWFLQIDALTLSPKPPSSGMKTDFKILDSIIANLQGKASNEVSLKVVVFDDADMQYAKMVHHRYPGLPFYLQVGNEEINMTDQPRFVSLLLDKYEWLINRVIEDSELKDVRVLPQLHSLVWGNKRGV
ncbi:7-carboxy-7-deazaguanine synthase QueE [Mesobacillus subterraneus]|uniref:7-carboxy-7-deazaguanine synthase n=1 Tax=Mesobacillus subterraneus TaxID=285983 RepID=A0A3R9DR66_9BACI|nr:7-carboxy-7-deazaguanine synthase QueE [Mesobacillus subterraneus]RSD25401.1 7-carboxy-7-deazaguanine synthase QueE [Mesobacillus subterraneus]